MRKATIHRTWARIALLEAAISLVHPSLTFAGGPSSHLINLHTLFGFKPGIPLAIVYADWRLTKPPTHNVPPYYVVPAYNPKNLPYNPYDPDTSPLEPPLTKGGPAYWGDKPYSTFGVLHPPSYYLSSFDAGESSNPALTNPADKVGYGRAFTEPANGFTTAGNAPALMVNLPTGDRPPDLAAIAAGKAASQDSSVVMSDTSAVPPDEFVPFDFILNTTARSDQPAASRPVGGQPATNLVARGSTAVSQPTTKDSRGVLLASAFAAEDARHARANLPMPVPPK